jgi:ATP-binding cassette subfamily F protein uup
VSHDRYLLDRVSTTVIGLNGPGKAGIFADYSQWEAARGEPSSVTAAVKEPQAQVNDASPKRKLSYIDQREWDTMEHKILEAEQDSARWQREVEEAASDAERLPEAYRRMQEAQARVAEFYARWAELEAKILK